MDFVDEMLDIDIGNNSVWSYRYFILSKAPEGLFTQHRPGSIEFVRDEVSKVLQKWLPRDLNNEAAWVYLRGMLATSEEDAQKSQKTNVKRVYIGHVKDLLAPFLNECETLTREKPEQQGLRFVMMCQIDLSLAEGETEKAVGQMEEMRDSVDKIRANYWQWRINRMGRKGQE